MSTVDSERDEWLIDESLKETFPASDPISPTRPGSLVGMRYAANVRAAATSPSLTRLPWLIGALVAGVIVGLMLDARRGGGRARRRRGQLALR